MSNQRHFQTADLCDAHAQSIRVVQSPFIGYGARRVFCGRIDTMQVYEDNVAIRQRLSTPGGGRVLVVDGGGSLRCALVGDMLAQVAIDNAWAGIVVNGCIRDSVMINTMPIGVYALGTNPLRCERRGGGTSDVAVTFAGVTFTPGEYIYADEDGIIVSAKSLLS